MISGVDMKELLTKARLRKNVYLDNLLMGIVELPEFLPMHEVSSPFVLAISGSRFYRVPGSDRDLVFTPTDLDRIFPVVFMSRCKEVITGGAVGFDQAVKTFVRSNYPSIKITTLRPEYLKGKTPEIKQFNKVVPKLNNERIVANSDVLITVASHSNSRGVDSTIEYGLKHNVLVKSYIYDFLNKSYLINNSVHNYHTEANHLVQLLNFKLIDSSEFEALLLDLFYKYSGGAYEQK